MLRLLTISGCLVSLSITTLSIMTAAMAQVRTFADALEAHVAADLWPLPTYREMLFIK